MKKISSSILFSILSLTYTSSAISGELHYGAGLGAMYSGIGINIGLKKETSYWYISAGCTGIGYSEGSGLESQCGPGVGWITSNILKGKKHGLGIYAGTIGEDRNNDTVFGYGATYAYFPKEISRSGWHFGVTPFAGRFDGQTKGGLFIEVGYQH